MVLPRKIKKVITISKHKPMNMINMKKNNRYMMGLLLIIGCVMLLYSNQIKAVPTFNYTVTVIKEFVPVGTKTPIFKIVVTNSGDTDMTISEIKLERTGPDMTYKTITAYQDEDQSNYQELIDTKELGGTVTPEDIAINIVCNHPHNSISGSSSMTIWVVVELDEDEVILGNQSNIEILEITGKDNVGNEKTDSGSGTKTSVITATGIEFAYFDINPEYVFPGSKDIPITYFTLKAVGEAIKDLTLEIEEASGRFKEKTGIESVSLYKNNSILDMYNFSAINPAHAEIQTIDYDNVNNHWSETQVTLNNWQEIDKEAGAEENKIWLVYNFGDDIAVTSNSKAKVVIEKLYGIGDTSELVMITTPNTQTSKQEYEIKFAGIEILDLKGESLYGDDTYGKNTEIPVLQFSLKAHEANVTVNQITIINNGTVPFYTGKDPGQNIKKVNIYYDTDQTNDFSKQFDDLVGSLELNKDSNNQTTIARVTTNIQLLKYSNYNDIKTFFVTYQTASNIQPNSGATRNYITAELGDIQATGNIPNIGDKLFLASIARNDRPLSSLPTADVNLVTTTIQLIETKVITPNSDVYDGEIKVPMLYVKFNSDSPSQTGKITIKNSEANYFGNATGVTKVWIYRDTNHNQEFDSTDEFIRSSTDFSNSNLGEEKDNNTYVTLDNIEFFNENEFLILYDIGILVSDLKKIVTAQIEDFGEGVIVSGSLPSTEKAAITPVSNPLEKVTINSVSNATTTFNIQIELHNTSSKDISINEIKPKFYLSKKNGMDISYEFSNDRASSFALDVNEDNKFDYNWSCAHKIPYSNGIAIIDFLIEYDIKTEGQNQGKRIVLNRYEDGSGTWHLVADPDNEQRAIISNMTSAEIPPSYLKHPIKICDDIDTNCYDFLNESSIGENKILSLEFIDASLVDESTIRLVRGSSNLYQKENLDKTMNSFLFNKASNKLHFYVGETSADITLTMNDLSGNEMPMTSLSYLISSSAELTNPLFHPNPYILGNNSLKLSYSVSTDNSNVTIYIYNHLGQQVYRRTESVNSGVNTLSISDSEAFMVPGIFICRIVAEDNEGNQSAKISKLAIY